MPLFLEFNYRWLYFFVDVSIFLFVIIVPDSFLNTL